MRVLKFIGKAFRSGLKLRARVPENAGDWSAGVDPFDILALKAAHGFTVEAEEKLKAQRPHAMVGDKPFGITAYGYGRAGSYAFVGGANVTKIYDPPVIR